MKYLPAERNRYFYGKLLTVRDFEIEQNYAINKRCLMNRTLQGAGVVCGMGVTVDNDSTLIIGSGVALDYEGREIVIEKPLLRKLQMIEGHETLGSSKDAWLCLRYSEEMTEPVNAVGNESSTRQFNLVEEGYHLSLTAQQPDYVTLLRDRGFENVNVLYQGEELTLVMAVPGCVCAADEFKITVLVVKNDQTPPVQFRLEGESTFLEVQGGRLAIDYHESSEEKRNVYMVEFPMRTQNISNIKDALLPRGGELNIELGSHHYAKNLTPDIQVKLVADEMSRVEYYRIVDSLEKRLDGSLLPIYLAKIELIHSADSIFVGAVTSLPLEQRLQGGGREVSTTKAAVVPEVDTAVHSLEYWQKPEVNARWSAQENKMRFDFGIPVPEQYDYTISHGIVDIPMPGGNRVNARYFSEEIPYGLGPGAVDIRLSVEFPTKEDSTALLFGNSEIFRKRSELNTPWVEVGSVVYPERGTMQIGVWLHDDVKGSALRVHYFASRPGLDTAKLAAERRISLSVMPEMARVQRGEQLRLKGTVVGSEDKTVLWRVKEAEGGTIDDNGTYTAPQIKGAYEIEAVSGADETVRCSAFMIVE